MRLQSRQVSWRIGSMPACSSSVAAAVALMWARAPAPSVTLTASAKPFNGVARARRSAGSQDTGGTTSAVTTNWPPVRRRASPEGRVADITGCIPLQGLVLISVDGKLEARRWQR
jgi:hypothetical protein